MRWELRSCVIRITRRKDSDFILYRVPNLPGFENLEGLHQRKRNIIGSIISANPFAPAPEYSQKDMSYPNNLG